MMRNPVPKVDVPYEHWDRLFSPVACAVMIATVDQEGRVNAASFATCVRQNHEPTCISFTVEKDKDTYHNVLPPKSSSSIFRLLTGRFWKKCAWSVCLLLGGSMSLKTGLTAISAKVVKPPRIAECKSH
jgi:flavin reductase (DIM6/NTAB) family NADH-FMN oxidoreductase RutF